MEPQNAGPEKLPQLMKFLHKGKCNYTDKVLLSMQLNFPVLSMFSCVAPQNAGFIDFMDRKMQV